MPQEIEVTSPVPEERLGATTESSRRAFGLDAVAASGIAVAAGNGPPARAGVPARRADPSEPVHTQFGSVRGTTLSGSLTRFLGIPYAAAPIGDLRFRSPRPHRGWRGVRDATMPGPSSIQTNAGASAWIYDSATLFPLSEDCLYLNVWTPGLRARLRPVLVFIHGGSARTGSGTVGCIDGEHLAQSGDVVVVTLNYRLGAMGLLSHPTWTDPATGFAGNWGVQDQLAALGWVRKNIESFGGDPDNVTIAGQSSSAGDVRHLTLQPENRGLYDKVIISSIKLSSAQTREQAASYTELLARRLGTSVEGLRSLPAQSLHDAEVALSGDRKALATLGGGRLAVIVDGRTVRDVSYFGKNSPDVPLLIGTNRNEQFIQYNLIDPTGNRVSASLPPATEDQLLPAIRAELFQNYPAGTIDPPPAELLRDTFRAAMEESRASILPAYVLMETATELVRRGPASHWAASHTAQNRHGAYLYELNQPLAPPGEGTPHTADLPFEFGTFREPFLAARVGSNRTVAAVSDALAEAWTTFAHTGSPVTGNTSSWRPYDRLSRTVADFGGPRGVTVTTDPRAQERLAFPVFL
ncbi:carboxylesterase/lipase family protein [Nocardia sp. NPDC050408]|uniref:carboxylesterase/lipase family protein n=1 Tax=Nocardia sp. NPDC050408 TaxID=3364319 RepID=UPI0037B9774B